MTIRLRIRLNQRGDSLVEVALALAIISSVIAGSFVTSSLAIRNGRLANERNVVVALEQQQVEIVRNLRDNYVVNGEQASPSYDGWSQFVHKLIPLAHPLCVPGSISGDELHLKQPVGAGLNVWTNTVAGNLITTDSNVYSVNTRGCFPDASEDTMIFTVHTTWHNGGLISDSRLSLTLTHVTGIDQQPPSYSVAPVSTPFTTLMGVLARPEIGL